MNRVKSQHAKLKKHLCAKNSSLDKFVGCIDQICFVAPEALDILEGEL
ncbi:hypothetical protein Gotur_008631 [Gossypium turneri]